MTKLKSHKVFSGTEVKSAGSSSYYDLSFYDYLGGSNRGDLRALEAIRLYKQCMPFFRAVELRAEAFSSIPFRVYETTTKSFVESHPILDLLGENGKPNPKDSLSLYKKGLSSFRDITGESFCVATGMKGQPPREISNVKPQEITMGVTNSRVSGMYEVPGSYRWNTTYFDETFKIDSELVGNSFRYWNDLETREIWQGLDFNPTLSCVNHRGLSKASPISLEIQQFVEGNTNNLSVLSRGARPSVAWVSQLDQPLTDEQYERWKEQVTSYEGAINAGKQVLVDAVEPKVISTTNKDMEFKENRKAVRTDIFVEYQIPLALVSPEQMTLDNLKTSIFQLYDLSVLPHADNLLTELTLFLMPRYPDSENLILTYNPIDIAPLKERAIEENSKLVSMAILTDNELRSRIGYEELEGGNSVWKQTSLAPAESDLFTGDNLRTPDNGEKHRALTEFVKHCLNLETKDGKRAHSDAEIRKMAITHGLFENDDQFSKIIADNSCQQE